MWLYHVRTRPETRTHYTHFQFHPNYKYIYALFHFTYNKVQSKETHQRSLINFTRPQQKVEGQTEIYFVAGAQMSVG